jgi:hypothetical protein
MKAEKAEVPALVSRIGCRGGLTSFVLSTSNALMRFEIPVPSVAFFVRGPGTGSVGNGGHCGRAVDTLRTLPLADLPRSGVVAALRRLVEWLVVGGLLTISRRRSELPLDMIGVTGERATDIGLASWTVAVCISSIRESSSERSDAEALLFGNNFRGSGGPRRLDFLGEEGSAVDVATAGCR